MDSKRNVIVNVHIEPANANDITPMPEILKEIEKRLGKLPRYMGPVSYTHLDVYKRQHMLREYITPR